MQSITATVAAVAIKACVYKVVRLSSCAATFMAEPTICANNHDAHVVLYSYFGCQQLSSNFGRQVTFNFG